jgi:hypothetical protein
MLRRLDSWVSSTHAACDLQALCQYVPGGASVPHLQGSRHSPSQRQRPKKSLYSTPRQGAPLGRGAGGGL